MIAKVMHSRVGKVSEHNQTNCLALQYTQPEGPVHPALNQAVLS